MNHPKVYLGDAVYAEFDKRTDSIVLTVEDGINITQTIVLNQDTLINFDLYRKRFDLLGPDP